MLARIQALISHSRFPLALFAVALILRCALLAATFPGNDQVDFYEDVQIATNLNAGHGYALDYSGIRVTNDLFGAPEGVKLPTLEPRPTALKPPAYPLLIAQLFRLFGDKNFAALFVVHALCAAATCVLLFWIGRRIDPWVGSLAAGGFAVYPPFVYHSVSSPEVTTLVLLLLATFVVLLLRYIDTGGWGPLLGAGTLVGVLAITESVAMLLAVCATIYGCCLVGRRATGPGLRTAALQLTTAGMLTVLFIAPWIYRNSQAFGEFPVVRSGFGTNVLLSLRRADVFPESLVVDIAGKLDVASELEEERLIHEHVNSWLDAHPDIRRQMIVQNFVEYSWETAKYKGDRSLRYLVGRKVPYVLLLLLALPLFVVGILRLLRHPMKTLETRPILCFGIATVVVYTTVHTLFGAHNVRYHFPVEFAFMLLAAEGLWTFATGAVAARSTDSRQTTAAAG